MWSRTRPPSSPPAARARRRADGRIVTFGIRPDRPATEYGYIRPGAALGGAGGGLFAVAAFVEKPDQATAARVSRRAISEFGELHARASRRCSRNTAL